MASLQGPRRARSRGARKWRNGAVTRSRALHACPKPLRCVRPHDLHRHSKPPPLPIVAGYLSHGRWLAVLTTVVHALVRGQAQTQPQQQQQQQQEEQHQMGDPSNGASHLSDNGASGPVGGVPQPLMASQQPPKQPPPQQPQQLLQAQQQPQPAPAPVHQPQQQPQYFYQQQESYQPQPQAQAQQHQQQPQPQPQQVGQLPGFVQSNDPRMQGAASSGGQYGGSQYGRSGSYGGHAMQHGGMQTGGMPAASAGMLQPSANGFVPVQTAGCGHHGNLTCMCDDRLFLVPYECQQSQP